MEPKSLKSISQKVIFLNINNTKKLRKELPIEDYNRLKERTLSTVVREYKGKMKFEGKYYTFFLNFLKQHSYFYDDRWRYWFFFCFTKEKDKTITLKNDKKIRDEMIKNEIKTKKYLIKNDFDELKGFRENMREMKNLFWYICLLK